MIDWPSQSLDLNPIEQLWAFIKRKLSEKKHANLKELKENIQELWNSIPSEFTERLVASMPKRVIEVLRAKGSHINY